jgi:hypothetical protein
MCPRNYSNDLNPTSINLIETTREFNEFAEGD